MTELVPDTAVWLVFLGSQETKPVQEVFRGPSRAACLDFIASCRKDGDSSTLLIYAPSSCHQAELKDQIAWQSK